MFLRQKNHVYYFCDPENCPGILFIKFKERTSQIVHVYPQINLFVHMWSFLESAFILCSTRVARVRSAMRARWRMSHFVCLVERFQQQR